MKLRVALTVSLLIAAAAVCLPASAVSQCISHAAPYKVKFGVVQMNIGRVDDWQSRLDEMIRFGVKTVRLNAKAGREIDFKAIAYAQKNGMDVLMVIHLTDKDFFDLSTEKRSGGIMVKDQLPLSQLDLSLYEKHFRKIVKSLDDMQVSIPMIEIGNEINWTGYNGDMPTMKEGRIFQTTNELGPYKNQVYSGFRRYESVLKISKKVLMESNLQKNARIISAGLMSSGSVEPLTPWFKRSGGTMLSLPLVNRIYDELGISKQVDGRGIHIYPVIKKNQKKFNTFDLIRDIVDKASTQCSPSGEPCYVTEWGFNSDHNGCVGDDPREIEFRDFLSALSCHSNFQGAWVFTWNAIGDADNDKKAISRCGRSASFGGALRDPGKKLN
jgi:hypothetical protein